MQFLDKIINQNAFSLDPSFKSKFFLESINSLTSHHFKRSNLYKDYLKGLNYIPKKNNNLSDIPFLPVRLFKDFDFISIKNLLWLTDQIQVVVIRSSFFISKLIKI